ncbi:hypothetical protein QJ856_gp0202 [Tupanvirus deep ocean]|uniref:Uncharacterized protein n=2 Tax=Tupanvirus TaxID=2094720 RepID=A0AC62A9U2_9VIRU|nr:hypothetical protein QJ856_gp0202 [Tupanvirus deep ocean]QKU34526.1 hypothetical protein [Tupanvirus deep ocean]
MSVTKQIVLFAIDIETNGPNMFRHEIISIGYCVGNMDGVILEKNRINFKFTSAFSDSCWNFWSKYTDVLDVLKRDAVEPQIAIRKFIDILDQYDDVYDVRIITDNPSYDTSFINFYLNRYLDRNPINYIKGNDDQYRCIFDTDSYSRGVLRMDYINPWISDSDVIKKLDLKFDANHSHYPDEDAEYIYKFHLALINKLNHDVDYLK